VEFSGDDTRLDDLLGLAEGGRRRRAFVPRQIPHAPLIGKSALTLSIRPKAAVAPLKCVSALSSLPDLSLFEMEEAPGVPVR